MWFQDEARIGRKNAQPRIGARKGTRPRRPADRRSEKTYLFAAIRPKRVPCAALVLPKANTEAMQPHLHEKAHGVVLMDRAGWRGTGKSIAPKNPTVILPPPKSPEPNPVENIRQYLPSNDLSNRVFSDDNAIVDAACDAWNAPIDTPRTIASIACRDRAHL